MRALGPQDKLPPPVLQVDEAPRGQGTFPTVTLLVKDEPEHNSRFSDSKPCDATFLLKSIQWSKKFEKQWVKQS